MDRFSIEFEFRRKDGSFLWAACNASPLFDENGKHIANISLFSDITERKKAEAEREIIAEALSKSELRYRGLSEHLETLVEERTKQLRDSTVGGYWHRGWYGGS